LVSALTIARVVVAGQQAPAGEGARIFSPTIPIAKLPQQASLYGVIVTEFHRLGWKTVCIGELPDPRAAAAVDPPPDVSAWLRERNAHFRPQSACRQDGEEVIDRESGAQSGVMVTLVGADGDRGDTLVRVQWCCWVGWGTFRLSLREGAWSLKRTEGWVQT
jgi:hypothetical protein